MAARRKIGEILVEEGYLDETQFSEALSAQQADRQGTGKIGQFLVSEGKVTPEQVIEAFSKQSGIKIATDDDLKKLDPLAGMKRIYGPEGLAELLKSLLRVLNVRKPAKTAMLL